MCTSYRNSTDEEKDRMQGEYDDHNRERELVFAKKVEAKKLAVEEET